jgi:hypothetical protein
VENLPRIPGESLENQRLRYITKALQQIGRNEENDQELAKYWKWAVME